MATVVIDASVVLAWFVPTRTQAEKDFCNGIRTRVFEIGLTIVAPAVFDMEVAGGLLKARRGKLISLAKFTEAREACERLPVEVHAFPYSISRIIDMSIGYHAQAADAMYLHVAQRHAATVITIDGGMAQACQQSKIRFETLKRSQPPARQPRVLATGHMRLCARPEDRRDRHASRRASLQF